MICFVSQMFLHGKNLANVYDTIDVSVLPEEYLPDEYTGLSAGATEQIVGKTSYKIQDTRSFI